MVAKKPMSSHLSLQKLATRVVQRVLDLPITRRLDRLDRLERVVQSRMKFPAAAAAGYVYEGRQGFQSHRRIPSLLLRLRKKPAAVGRGRVHALLGLEQQLPGEVRQNDGNSV